MTCDEPVGTEMVGPDSVIVYRPSPPPKMLDDEAEELVGRVAALKWRIAVARKKHTARIKSLEWQISRQLDSETRQRLEAWANERRKDQQSFATYEGHRVGFDHVKAKATVVAPEQALVWVKATAHHLMNTAEVSGPEDAAKQLALANQLLLLVEERINPALIDPRAFRIIDENGEFQGYASPPGIEITPEREQMYIRQGRVSAPASEPEDGEEADDA